MKIMRRILKLCLLSVMYKSKPVHENMIILFISEVRNSQVLSPIVNELNINLQSLGINPKEAG